MDHAMLIRRAEIAARWALNTQIKSKQSADCGRYLRSVDIETDQQRLASSWLQGVQIKALLALHEATGKPEYLESCRAAAAYIKTLQQMDGRYPHRFGYIVEVQPQDRYGHPRDALTAAWAMLLLHRADGDEELRDRALVFADWFTEHGMDEHYPYWTVYLDGCTPPLRQRGSFHGGSAAFFNDLFELTGQERWLAVARKIADYHIDRFLRPDGSLRITLSPDGEDLTGRAGEDPAWEHMHKFNDDFTALAMMKLGELTGLDRYTEAGLRFCRHLLANQQASGGFGDPVVTSASGVGALSLVRAAQVDPANSGQYLPAVERALDHVLELQERDSPDSRLLGAFYSETDPKPDVDWRGQFVGRTVVHLRTTAYSTSALAMIGGRCRRSYYNVSCGAS